MTQLANSWWLYLLGAIVCVYVLIGCVVFIIKAIKDSKTLGMDMKIIKKTLIDSAIFSILPSISILIGLFALSGKIGIPFPWIRLTVIGAIHYEASAVDAAYSNVLLESLTTTQFATIAFTMTLGILSGPIFCLFFMKFYDKKVLSKIKTEVTEDENTEELVENKENGEDTSLETTSTTTEQEKPKKKAFGPILFSAAFIAMICSFLAEYFALLKNTGKEGETPLSTFTPTIVVLVSFGSMALLTWISNKFKVNWLKSFALGFSMIIGMGVSIVIELIWR